MFRDNKTHVVPAFTRTNERGEQETACRIFIAAAQIVPSGVEPSCWGCNAWLEGLDRQPTRRLTRHEQLQELADHGCDTREEYEERR